jgi:nuclear GTP-binding protein
VYLQAARRNLGGTDELAGLAADAVHRASAYEGTMVPTDMEDDGTRDIIANARAGESTRRAFYRQLKAVMEKADIILEVLDARDPLACRAPAVEALALAMDPPKRIVLVLNKIDLVPAEVVQKWLVHLRKEFPAVAFKASTQQQRSHLAAPGGSAVNQATEHGDVVTGSGAAGADTLLQLLKNYSRSHDLKTSITVGVVGYPNVGKSSVINSMKRSKAVGVSSTPGFTKNLQEVSLDAKVTLIDCPGIIFDDNAGAAGDEDDGGAGLLLRNCISVDAIDDPETAVDGILKRCAPDKLMSLYSIPAFETTNQFLTLVAGARGKVAKGGVADKIGAAKSVLQDWNSGKIPFFVLPPDDSDEDEGMTAPMKAHSGAGRAATASVMRNEEDIGASAIVSQWAQVRTVVWHCCAAGLLRTCFVSSSAIPMPGGCYQRVRLSACDWIS